MSTSQLRSLTRAARCCAALAAAAALWAGIAPDCQGQNPPPNDNFAKAQGIIGVSGSVLGTNLYATAQTSEPAPYPGNPAGASIWYAWTAPINTTIDFNTRGSTTTNGYSLDTALAVYRLTHGTNAAFTNLTLVAQNEQDPSGGVTSRVDFGATLGTLYLIQVDGAAGTGGSNAEGYLTLNWSPSLVAGTFQFTTSLYPMGAADDGFLVTPPNQDTYTNFTNIVNGNDLSPSLHNPIGENNGRITITRTGGYTGRCEVELIVTNGLYTNIYFTNYSGTNIFITNFVGGVVTGFTNIFYTNMAVEGEFANDYLGFISYFDNFAGSSTNTVTDANGTVTEMGGMEFLTNLFSGPCISETGDLFTNTVVNGTITNVIVTRTNLFCTTTSGEVVVPAAIDGEDYMSSDSTNLTFDDFQMSQDVYLTLPGYFFDGVPPGPQSPNLLYANGLIKVILANVVLDPKEDPDIIPPTISPSLGTSQVNVLNIGGLPFDELTTNVPFGGEVIGGMLAGYATLNFERATFRINKPALPNTVQTNTIWVIRDPPVWPTGSTIQYTIDTTPASFNVATINWNRWPAVAGSDFAVPSVNTLADFDFMPTYTGDDGTLTFPANVVGLDAINIVVTNNGAQEFDSDIYVQLYETAQDAMGNHPPKAPTPTFLGNIENANLTINFNNPNPGVQPGGAWDRTFNPDSASNSIPPLNPLPGANAPVQAVAIQPNGEAIIGGDFTSYDSSTNTSYVVRLTSTGFVDSSFNPGSGPNGPVDAIAVDSTGRIYIGGQFTAVNGVRAFHIARLTPSGALDTTFAKGSGFDSSSTVWALSIDGSGNILVGGSFTNYNTTNCNRIARLLPSGGLDTSFLPSSGAPNEGADSDVRAVATDSLGNVILGGDFTHANGTNWNHIARLLKNGALDVSFNPGFGPDNSVYALAIQPNNSIILGGAFAHYNLIPSGSVARLGQNGVLDTTFATGTGANGPVYSLVLQANGTILIGGQFTSYNTTRRIAIARLLNNGWLDTSFMDTAYNQFAGFINHYYNVNAVNINDLPAEYNSLNIVSAMALDGTGNVVVGGSFTRVGGGTTRDAIHFQQNVTRLIAAPTPGPETGGIGNDPGNIGMTLSTYSVGDTAGKLYVSLDRVNGSLGPASLTLGTNTFPPGPGSATQADFGLATPTAEFDDVFDLWNLTPSGVYGWRTSDGYYAFNYETQPSQVSDGGASALGLVIHNDPAAGMNLNASLALLNLSSFGLLKLGGQTIPTGPALGQSSAQLEIVDNNFVAGTLGFSASNYTVVNTAGTVTITVLRTNGSTGPVSVNYTTERGFTNGAGTNVANPGINYQTTSGTLNFAPGVLSQSFTVPILDQSVLVPTTFFNIVLSDPGGDASLDTNVPPLVPSTTVVEIIDGNFQPGHLEFSSPSYGVLKGSPATITVNRVGGALGGLTVECGTSDGTAVNGTNYVGTTNKLAWASQSVAPQTITIPTLQDNVVEGAKTVNVSLFAPNVVGSQGGVTNLEVLSYPSNAVLTINDIDSYGTLNFSVPDFNVLQTANSALITVTRTGGTVGTVSVNYTTLDGTNAHAPFQPAYAGTNYGATSGMLTFGPGVSSLSFSVPIYATPSETSPANRIVDLVLFGGSPGISNQFPKTALLTILDPQLVLSPAGSVDQTIQNGIGFNNDVQSLSLQPDGSLLTGGDFTFFNGFPFNYIGRLIPNANFDNAFLGAANATVCQVLSQEPNTNQSDGSIMMVGEFTQADGVNRAGIARLNLDGSLDQTFNPGAGADSTVYSIVEQFLPAAQSNLPSVPFYVIGGNFANFDGAPAGGVARLTAAGQLDPNFDLGAGVTGTNAAVHAVALEPDNQILVAGDFMSFDNAPHHHLVRLNVDGSVDSTFAAFDGVSSDINGSVRALQVQPDGRIIIGGLFTTVSGSNYNYIARLNNDGTVDTNFNVGVGCNNGVLALALDSQLRILVGGEFTRASGVTRNGITRLNPDGTVDPAINFGFGANGYIDSIVLETNDEIDVAGSFTAFNNIPENDFVRLYGGANAGDGSLEFSQQVYGVLESGTNAIITIERLGGEGTTAQPTVNAEFYTSDTTNGVSGQNYISVATNIVFPFGETFETVMVPILDSPVVAPNAVVGLNLTNATNAAIGPQASAILVITNVNTAVGFSAESYRQSANAAIGYADIPVVRIGNPNSSFSVTVFTGTFTGIGAATPYVNYTPVTNVLNFTPGVMTVDWQVPITNSPTQFADLSVALEMGDATNAIIGSPSSATLVIASVNNAPGDLAFSQTNYTVSEGATNAAITIVRTNGTLNTVSALLTTSNLTALAGTNYIGYTNTVIFDANVTSQTIYIPVIQQTVAGANVTALLTLSDPTNATIGAPSQATLTIDNDLENFSIGSANYYVDENVGTVFVTIQRNGPTNVAASVSYTTYSPTNANDTNGYAVPGVDYVPTSGRLVFGPGSTLQTIPINIIQGNSVNGLETFQIILENPSAGAQLGSPDAATVVITSDVTGFAFSTNTYTVGENGSNVVITVNRINPNTGAVSVRFATSDNTAVSGQDYVETNGTLSFLNGQATANFSVQILNPDRVEASKNFSVELLEPSTNSYVVAPSNAVVVITNVNTGVSFTSSSYAVSECAGLAAIEVVLTGVTNGNASVDFSTADISGKSNINYFATNGTLYFTNGQTVQEFLVPVINNHVIGPDHTVQVNLSNPTNAQLLNPSTAILTVQECNGAFIVASGTAFVTGSILPGTGVIYPNDVVTVLLGLRDIAGGNTTNLVATLMQTNGVTNGTSSANYGILVQNGPTKSEPFTFTAIGTNGQNISATLSLQDGARNLGTVAFGFTIGGTTFTFTNSEALTFMGVAPLPSRATNSSPPGFGYPSTINVSGIVGTVTAVTATLTNFGHTYPEDVNVVLEAPGGQDSILMSHCGLSFSVQDVTLTFSQSAAVHLPTNSVITSGTYLPTTNAFTLAMTPLPAVPNNEPFTAPPAPYPANLGAFVGAAPNGNWALWIDDDDTLDSGYVSNGWILNISIGTQVENDSDLEISFTPSTTNASLGNTLSYQVTLTNFGPSAATNVVISNAIPSGMTYLSNSCDCGGMFTNGVLTFSRASLAVGAGTAFEVYLLPTELGYSTNTIGAFADEADPNSNNVVTSIVLVSSPEADVGVAITEIPDPVYAGSLVTYTIVVTNNGPSAAPGATSTITLPAGFNVVSLSPSAGASNSSGTITWNIGTLGIDPVTSTATLTVVARPLIGGVGLATATVSSAVYDPTKVNNFASVKTEVLQPVISVSVVNGSYTLTWPATATNYVLEGAFELPPIGTWVPITNPPPQVISGQYSFTLPGAAGYSFFRLANPMP